LIEGFDGEIYQGTVKSLGGSLFEYVDALEGIEEDGAYEIEDAYAIPVT